jgi:hypothetical protein
MILLISCFEPKDEKREYTVIFIGDYNDTSYLFNSRLLTLKEAKDIANNSPIHAEPLRVIDSNGVKIKY